ncbi:MAG: hypothetical protein U0795_11000 [Pirellulales bacterium]
MKREPGTSRWSPGGVIHTYLGYDPQRFPSPTQPPADLVSPLMEHLLAYGSLDDITPDQLAKAVRIDPSQMGSLGPSLDALLQMLRERKRKILETYTAAPALQDAQREFQRTVHGTHPPESLKESFQRAVASRQIYALERLWYQSPHEQSRFSRQLLKLIQRLGNQYELEQLLSKYDFTGRRALTVEQALEVKAELEEIDRLIQQLEEARKNAQIGLIDLDSLADFADEQSLENLRAIRQMVEDYLREQAARQGLEQGARGYQLTPHAMRLFQSKLLEKIFSQLQASRTGRHQGPVEGEGSVELPQTKDYEFGDSLTQLDIPQSLTNALLREGPGLPIRLRTEDLVVHRSRNTPKCATSVVMDMSGSMRYDGQYIHVKKMALALDGLIRREYPGDFLQFIEMYTFAALQRPGDLVRLMPKPVTIYDPVVQLRVDMSREEVSETLIPPHFTNIQHSLRLARQILRTQPTPNKQIILITDGLPTAHFEEQWLFMLYPPHPRTEAATMAEGLQCAREGITINIFLLPSWSQTSADVKFAHRLAESTKGRVFFTAGRDLDRFVVWDYVQRKREIVA